VIPISNDGLFEPVPAKARRAYRQMEHDTALPVGLCRTTTTCHSGWVWSDPPLPCADAGAGYTADLTLMEARMSRPRRRRARRRKARRRHTHKKEEQRNKKTEMGTQYVCVLPCVLSYYMTSPRVSIKHRRVADMPRTPDIWPWSYMLSNVRTKVVASGSERCLMRLILYCNHEGQPGRSDRADGFVVHPRLRRPGCPSLPVVG
jgi:hypothetical protein